MKVAFGKQGTVTASKPVEATPDPVAVAAGVALASSPDGTVTEVVVAPESPVAPPEPGTAVAVVPPAPPAPAVRAAVVVDDDKIALADVKIPALNVVQGVGDLCQLFLPGTIVYDQQVVLAGPPPKPAETKAGAPEQTPVNIVLIGFRPTRYAEKTEAGAQGRILSSVADVHAVGGTTVYDEAYSGAGKERKQLRPYFTPLATALILIEAPAKFESAEPIENVFPLEVQESTPGEPATPSTRTRRFVIGFWHLRGTAHTAVAKPVKTARLFGALRAHGYRSKWLRINTALKTFGGNVTFVPTYKIGEDTSTEVRELAQSVLDGLMSAE